MVFFIIILLLLILFVFFFFFKQKTAYEMRISDWSSDVCSSDLLRRHSGRTDGGEAPAQTERIVRVYGPVAPAGRTTNSTVTLLPSLKLSVTGTRSPRSEEHTSELQSLMRRSYAVFCLKKKIIINA